jgi:hypothetical protein
METGSIHHRQPPQLNQAREPAAALIVPLEA